MYVFAYSIFSFVKIDNKTVRDNLRCEELCKYM